jgi:hypothetical protein
LICLFNSKLFSNKRIRSSFFPFPSASSSEIYEFNFKICSSISAIFALVSKSFLYYSASKALPLPTAKLPSAPAVLFPASNSFAIDSSLSLE